MLLLRVYIITCIIKCVYILLRITRIQVLYNTTGHTRSCRVLYNSLNIYNTLKSILDDFIF